VADCWEHGNELSGYGTHNVPKRELVSKQRKYYTLAWLVGSYEQAALPGC
jgi:hypothetical protein